MAWGVCLSKADTFVPAFFQSELSWTPGQACVCLTHLLARVRRPENSQAVGSPFLETEPKLLHTCSKKHRVVMAMGRGKEGTSQVCHVFPLLGILRQHPSTHTGLCLRIQLPVRGICSVLCQLRLLPLPELLGL